LIVLFSFLTIIFNSSGTPAQETNSNQEKTISVESASGEAEIALAKHLQRKQAKIYGAYWCSHCYEQIYLFGQQAFSLINRIECDPEGKNSQPKLCKANQVTGYPTWKIDGKSYSGLQSLDELADISGYQGQRNFKVHQWTEQITNHYQESLAVVATFRNIKFLTLLEDVGVFKI
jgi:hypothetical protein